MSKEQLRKARAVWTTGAEAFFQGSEQRDCGGWGQVGCGSELVEKDTGWVGRVWDLEWRSTSDISLAVDWMSK